MAQCQMLRQNNQVNSINFEKKNLEYHLTVLKKITNYSDDQTESLWRILFCLNSPRHLIKKSPEETYIYLRLKVLFLKISLLVSISAYYSISIVHYHYYM